jgi:hypothetical protein
MAACLNAGINRQGATMQRKSIGLLTLALAAALSPTAYAVEPLTTYVAYLNGTVDIAPDGSVQNYSVTQQRLIEDRWLVSKLDRHIKAWRFVPITDNGQPAIAHIAFGLTLHADTKPHSSAMAVSLSDVQFYDASLVSSSGTTLAPLPPPRFPSTADRNGVGARVTVVLKLDDDGRVLEKDVNEMELLLSKGIERREATSYAQDFREASLDAVGNWTIPESYRQDCARPCVVAVPLLFTSYASSDGFWHGLKSIPVAPIPWITPETRLAHVDPGGAPASTRQLVDPAQATGQL